MTKAGVGVEVPSYSYPGLDVFLEIMKRRKEGTLDQISRELGVKSWRVRSALSMLSRMSLVRKRRKGRSVRYKPVKGDLRGAFLFTFYRHLLRLSKPHTTGELASKLWKGEKRATSMKRAKYLVSMGTDLGVIRVEGRSYQLEEFALRKTAVKAVIEAYKGEKGDYVPLTKILDKLEEWGLERDLSKEMILKASREMGWRLTPSPAISDEVIRDGIPSEGGYLYFLLVEG